MEALLTNIATNPSILIYLVIAILIVTIGFTLGFVYILKNVGIRKISKEGIELTNKEKIELRVKAQEETSDIIHDMFHKQMSIVEDYLKNKKYEINEFIDKSGYCHSDFNVSYVIAKLEIEIHKWIVFNNIEDERNYVVIHQEKLWLNWKNLIRKIVGYSNCNKIRKGEEIINFSDCDIDWQGEFFKKLMFTTAGELIAQLANIKRTYLEKCSTHELR